MWLRLLLAISSPVVARATIIDRTAIVVDRKPILDSEIARDIRVNDFLNRARIDFGPAARKASASRLIDQELIRQQIRLGGYPITTAKETSELLNQIIQGRFGSESSFQRTLKEYGISENELRERLSWQLTVLHFIDMRFRPQVTVSEEEVKQYSESHPAQFNGKPPAELHSAIVEQITGERINFLLDDWLADARKSAHIQYLEKSLK